VPELCPHTLPLNQHLREFYMVLTLLYVRRQACPVLISCMHEHPSAPATASCVQHARMLAGRLYSGI